MRPASKEQHAKTTRTFYDAQRHVFRAALQTPVETICTCLLPICLSKEMLFASFWNASELQWTSLALMRRLLLSGNSCRPKSHARAWQNRSQHGCTTRPTKKPQVHCPLSPALATRTHKAMRMQCRRKWAEEERGGLPDVGIKFPQA